MISESPPIRLAKAQLSAAANTLTKAFFNDPFINYLHPDPERRAKRFAVTADRILRFGLMYGEVQATSAAIEGVAVWLPPTHGVPSLWDMLRAGAFSLPFHVGLRSFSRMLTYLTHSDKMRQRNVHVPHWYLQMFGVDLAHQGKGFGSFLMRSMLDRLDRDGIPCCLDTENESNVAMYQHFGFRVLESSPVPGSPCGCWLMFRDVGGKASS
jgi:ribosomal protein S18 acetylase RimI-like enzyme